MELLELRQHAHAIFDSALASVDPRAAVFSAAQFDGHFLHLFERVFDLSTTRVYVIAIGKAATAMALGLHDSLGDRISKGIITGSALEKAGNLDLQRWQLFSGGHPLPNQESLSAAKAAFELLDHAGAEPGLVVFLISGGGSAMIEWPRNDRITLSDLREANRQLISCGAAIAEINAVRRAFSLVKGGGLAARALSAEQIVLIVSDTNESDERSVASGPALSPPADELDAQEIIARYGLATSLPAPILIAILQHERSKPAHIKRTDETFYVLLDNRTALNSAAEKARSLGWAVDVTEEICEQPIAEGCSLLLDRSAKLQEKYGNDSRPVALLSGGEFSCPVKGNGVGGRNLETVLRGAIALDKAESESSGHCVVLSGGTDGLDGNSPAAGAIADETTISRARPLGLDVENFLERSDSFSFFRALGDEIITGSTGTNVRDVRIVSRCL
jgi:glycerate 2-kinase